MNAAGRSIARPAKRLRLLCATAALMAVAGLAWAQSGGFRLVNGEVKARDGVLYFSADYDFQLSPAAEEALGSGVPLTIDLHIQVVHPRDWIWDSNIADLSQRYEIRYHALSRRYVIRNLNSGERRIFTRRDAALTALGTVRDLPVLDRRLLNQGERYRVRAKASLDIEALPHPLRTVAYMSPEWQLGTDWHHWDIRG